VSDREPLYIGGRTTVAYDDGPSLVVSAPGMVICRYPLQRISRLLLSTEAVIESHVMVGCLDAGIAITWVDPCRGLIGVALPAEAPVPGLQERVAIMMAHSRWRDSYDGWLTQQYDLAHKAVARHLGIQFQQQRNELWLSALLQRTGFHRGQAMLLLRAWRAMSASLLLDYWRMLDVPSECLANPADGWNVLLDMSDCLALAMLPDMFQQKRFWRGICWAERALYEAAAIRAFESRKARQRQLIEQIHSRFCRWLREMEPWR